MEYTVESEVVKLYMAQFPDVAADAAIGSVNNMVAAINEGRGDQILAAPGSEEVIARMKELIVADMVTEQAEAVVEEAAAEVEQGMTEPIADVPTVDSPIE